MQCLWQLPGPARFVRSIGDELRNGSSVVVHCGSAVPDGLAEELERHCYWGFRWSELDAGPEARPLAAIRRVLPSQGQEAKVASVADLVRLKHFQERLIWVSGVSPESWPAWRIFLQAYSDASRNHVPEDRRTALVVPLQGAGFQQPDLSDVAVTHRKFRDVVHRDDLYVMALQHEDSRGPSRHRMSRALRANSVAHISQWDHSLAEQMLETDLQSALQPRAILESYARGRGWIAETVEDWEVGTVDGPQSRPVVHSALLAIQGREAELDRRLWAAQASVLMPLLEERRVELIDRHRTHFKLPFETELGRFEEPDDLELGPLLYYFQLHGPPNGKAMGEARRLRAARNKLAHIKPLKPSEALHPVLLGA